MKISKVFILNSSMVTVFTALILASTFGARDSVAQTSADNDNVTSSTVSPASLIDTITDSVTNSVTGQTPNSVPSSAPTLPSSVPSPTITEPVRTGQIRGVTITPRVEVNTTPSPQIDKNSANPSYNNDSQPSAVTRPINSAPVAVSGTTTRIIKEYRDLNSSFGAVSDSVRQNRRQLIEAVDKHISKVVSEAGKQQSTTTIADIVAIRAKIIRDYDLSLIGTTTVSREVVEKLAVSVNESLLSVNIEASSTQALASSTQEVSKVMNSLKTAIEAQSDKVKSLGGDDLYKDSNNDGISDYESVRLYNIDPVKPSPVTTYNGQSVTAGEKILLGLDPTKSEAVKIVPEEPVVSLLPPTPAYKVDKVELNAEKKVAIKGQALPNSFVTLYIYSTPIIVTVKTNSAGEWEYTLDKEIDTGEHKIYTASVNNSGKIVAISYGFTFVKTAEAAALADLSQDNLSNNVTKPSLVENWNIYMILTIFVGIVFLAIGLISLVGKNNNDVPPNVPNVNV